MSKHTYKKTLSLQVLEYRFNKVKAFNKKNVSMSISMDNIHLTKDVQMFLRRHRKAIEKIDNYVITLKRQTVKVAP